MKNRYYIDTISILAILTNIIRYRYGIDASGIEAEPDVCEGSIYMGFSNMRGFVDMRLLSLWLHACTVQSNSASFFRLLGHGSVVGQPDAEHIPDTF
jgi:hypothetical protein